MEPRRTAFACACLLLAGAGIAQSRPGGSLYEQLGGKTAVHAFFGGL
jgi:hypothetical protein